MCGCDEALELISASLDGTLTREEQGRLEEHLASCPACRALARDLAELHDLMPEEVELPAGLHGDILARVAADPALPAAPRPKKRPIWRTWAPMAAVFALVLAGAGLSMRMGWLGGGVGTWAGGAPAQAALSAAPSAGLSDYDTDGAAAPSAAPEMAPMAPELAEGAETGSGQAGRTAAAQDKAESPQGAEPAASPGPRTFAVTGPGLPDGSGEPAPSDAAPSEPTPAPFNAPMPGGESSRSPAQARDTRQAVEQAAAWLAASDLEGRDSIDVTQVRVEVLTEEQRAAALCDEGREELLDETDLVVTLGDPAGQYAQVVCDSATGAVIGYLPESGDGTLS